MHKGGDNNRQENGFTPEAEDEFIKEAVPHKLDITLVNASKNVLR